MKTGINPTFIPIYNNYLAKIKKPPNQTRRQKVAYKIFTNQQFNIWLGTKYKEKLTRESYPKFCTENNFKKFLPSFIKTKDSKENKEYLSVLEEQVWVAEKCPPKRTKPYDVDIIKAYHETVNLLERVEYDVRQRSKQEYLEGIKYEIILFCKDRDLPTDYIILSKYSLIANNNLHNFDWHLGRTLISYDSISIDALLNYQNKIWKQKASFVALIKHRVYRFVLKNSPFDNGERLKAIMEWVAKKEDEAKHSKTKKDISPSFSLIALEDNKDYILLKTNHLEKILEELKKEGFIAENTKPVNFNNVFSGKLIKLKNKINWKGSNIELKMVISMLMGDLKKIKAIEYKWDTTAKCFLNDGKDLEATQLDKARGSRHNEAKLREIFKKL